MILLVKHMVAFSRTSFHIVDFIHFIARSQRGVKKYNRAMCASCFTRKNAGRSHRVVDRAYTFRFSRVRRSAFIDNVDVERNKAAVIAELTYGYVCSLAPGDAATLISKPKVPCRAHVPYKSRP